MNHIKIAGLASVWDSEYAKAYADKLHEMGFYAKAVPLEDRHVVAYSHKSFTREDFIKSMESVATPTSK